MEILLQRELALCEDHLSRYGGQTCSLGALGEFVAGAIGFIYCAGHGATTFWGENFKLDDVLSRDQRDLPQNRPLNYPRVEAGRG